MVWKFYVRQKDMIEQQNALILDFWDQIDVLMPLKHL